MNLGMAIWPPFLSTVLRTSVHDVETNTAGKTQAQVSSVRETHLVQLTTEAVCRRRAACRLCTGVLDGVGTQEELVRIGTAVSLVSLGLGLPIILPTHRPTLNPSLSLRADA